MTVTTSKAGALREALVNAIDGGFDDLIQIAILLRFLQLQEQVLHPDDCCEWSAYGSDAEMKQLGAVLLEQGLESFVDQGARRLMAEVRFARNTLRAIKDAEGDFGEDLATLESWSGAAEAALEAEVGA